MPQTMFISYSWANSDIANKIDIAFLPTGLIVHRDIRDIQYKGSIKNFMKQIRETDFVLMLISDNFLTSSNCMFEVIEFMKETEFKDKILPVIVDGTKIFTAEDKLFYIKFWKDKYERLKNELANVEITDSLELYNELKHYEKIRTSIDEFLSFVTGVNVISFSELYNNNFRQLFQHIGVTDQVVVEKLLNLFRIANVEEKEIELEKLERDYPNNAKVNFGKGYLAYTQGHVNKSNFYYSQSIKFDPNFSASFYNLGYNKDVSNEINEAITLYKKTIELDPLAIRAYTNLGRIYAFESNQPNEAKYFYEEAVKINPYDGDAQYNLATFLTRFNIDDAAAKYHFERAINLQPTSNCFYNYGMLLENHFNNYSLAAEQYKLALKLEPNHKLAIKQLAFLYEETYKHFNTSKIYYDKLVSIDPVSAEEHYRYAAFIILHFDSNAEYMKKAKYHFEKACGVDAKYQNSIIARAFL